MHPSQTKPKVTIVILNWNKRNAVIELMNSLSVMTYDNYFLVIVDNASTDDSVSAIRSHALRANVLVNTSNLGGTGGFNTGLRQALRHSQEYIWLLDNDAEILPDTLAKLVDAMESDVRIGIAGSCILSTEDRDLIVEAGSRIDWRSAMCRPYLRYEKRGATIGMKMFDVDVVPACSVLLRDSMVRAIGIMDERYYLHWDDVDYCLTAKKAGYRVVNVPTSYAYHSAEKGYSPAITLYYDFRNTLLLLSKHARGLKRIRAMHSVVSRYMAAKTYFSLLGQSFLARYIKKALADFRNGTFGSFSATTESSSEDKLRSKDALDASVLARYRRILVYAVGSYEDIRGAIALVRAAAPHCYLGLAVPAERQGIYRKIHVDELITYDIAADGFADMVKVALNIMARGYQCGVMTKSDFTIPYAHLLPTNLRYDNRSGLLLASAVSLSSIWKIPIDMVIGKVSSLYVMLLILGIRNSGPTERSPS